MMIRPVLLALFGILSTTPGFAQETNVAWSESRLARLPDSETPVRLFNGKDLTGWHGQIAKYWSVADGVIVARNSADNAPAASTYLLTDKEYRNFRLIFEAKLVTSEMHSGVALWGDEVESEGDPHSYKGHLVMFPSGYGFYDLYRRNSIYRDREGKARKVGHQHDWNRMEILAIGSRIRFALNGHEVADWTDPMPELCGSGPIGLQLHKNTVPQELHFRGLILTENPEDKLVTVGEEVKTSQFRIEGDDDPVFAVQVSGSGPPMILIPGLSCGADVWKETLEHFQDRYECHALTLAGFAGQPPIDDAPLLPRFRDGVIAYIARQKLDRPIIIGHSMGGLLAFWIAASAPESVGPVIAVDGPPFYSALLDPDITPETAEKWASERRSLVQNAGPLQNKIQNRFYLSSLITDRNHFQRVAAESDESDQTTVAQAMYELMTTDLREEVARIQSPVLLIAATGSSPDEKHRRNTEDRYRRQIAAIPNHKAVFNAKSRHFIQFDAPEWFWEQIARFLGPSERDGGAKPGSVAGGKDAPN